MARIIVLEDIEATADGMDLRSRLSALVPTSVQLDFGRSQPDRAMLALRLVDAVVSRFVGARFAVTGRRAVRRLLSGHLHATGARLSSAAPSLVVDVAPGVRQRSEWIEGAPPVLRVASVPYPGRRQHAAEHWLDSARILRTIARELGRGAFPHVYVCFDMLSPPAMKRLLRRANACVSLHRAEGFGLTLAEAMAAEKPVVATGYSGNLEFMDGDSAFLVDYRLTPVRERLTRTSLFDPRLSWAEPLHDAAVAALRACVDSPALAARVARRGWNRVSRELSSERIGRRMRSLLQEQPTFDV
ncbi:MAG TPA: glycosyltransferase [Polyangiaceae bacterium]|nr:glycosyltransferase [Polyangiaceae bacterium]